MVEQPKISHDGPASLSTARSMWPLVKRPDSNGEENVRAAAGLFAAEGDAQAPGPHVGPGFLEVGIAFCLAGAPAGPGPAAGRRRVGGPPGAPSARRQVRLDRRQQITDLPPPGLPRR
jgi:hypothetical protein